MEQNRLPLKSTGRPNQYFELGGRGRKTGWVPPQQVKKDQDGFDDVEAFFDDDENISNTIAEYQESQRLEQENTNVGRDETAVEHYSTSSTELSSNSRSSLDLKNGVFPTRSLVGRTPPGSAARQKSFSKEEKLLPNEMPIRRESGSSSQTPLVASRQSIAHTVPSQKTYQESDFIKSDNRSKYPSTTTKAVNKSMYKQYTAEPQKSSKLRNAITPSVVFENQSDDENDWKSARNRTQPKKTSTKQYQDSSSDNEDVHQSLRQRLAPATVQKPASRVNALMKSHVYVPTPVSIEKPIKKSIAAESPAVPSPVPSTIPVEETETAVDHYAPIPTTVSTESTHKPVEQELLLPIPIEETEQELPNFFNDDDNFGNDDYGGFDGGDDDDNDPLSPPHFDDLPPQHEDDEEDEEEHAVFQKPVKEKSKASKKEKKASTKEKSKPKSKPHHKEAKQIASKSVIMPVSRVFDEDENDGAARRSKRARIAPVAFWKNEKAIYERRQSGVVLRDVIRVVSDDEGPMKKTKSKSKSQRVAKTKREVALPSIEQPPTEIKVINYITKEEEYQKIAVTSESLDTSRTVGAGEYSFQKVFNEGEFLATGVLELPEGSTKPSKNSHSSAMVFIIISGHVQVQVHKTSFELVDGGQFFVPRGNQYSITNVGDSNATLYFCHGKQVSSF